MFLNFMAQNGASSILQTLFLIVIFGAGMYFIIIRPQKKQMEAQKERLASIKKGDEVVTRSGLHGVIDSVDTDKHIFVLDANGIYLTFEINAILKIDHPTIETKNEQPEASTSGSKEDSKEDVEENKDSTKDDDKTDTDQKTKDDSK